MDLGGITFRSFLVSMRKEWAYGVIPVWVEGGAITLCMVYNIRPSGTDFWSFPKGHPDGEESEKETAQRELEEETGLFIDEWLELPPVEDHYQFVRGNEAVDKHVRYYFAIVQDTQARPDAQEVGEVKWVPLEEVEEQMTFPEGKQLARQMVKQLEKL
ncbi:MAG: hypothetical protein S4CHLAM102_10920 [Chlamydiia bacterium]|nr:hypothetical protein [Chlamydiia bacterium]